MCPFAPATVYTKNQPLDSRKLGFGSHNAKNRDEFTLHIRTEQYRELLKVRGWLPAVLPGCRRALPLCVLLCPLLCSAI